jgi:hypothetical protein
VFYRQNHDHLEECVVEVKDGDFDLYRSDWARVRYQSSRLDRLGTLGTIKEGEHAIRREGLRSASRSSRRNPLPLFEDHRLTALGIAPVRWWPATAAAGFVRSHHEGERILLRKTGAGLLVAEVDSAAFVLAHQNVYVVKSRVREVPVRWLGLVLASAPMQRLYREGPHGQPGRPMAQLRIAHLKRLPFPGVRALTVEGARLDELWRTRRNRKQDAGWERRLTTLVEGLLAPEDP